MGGSPTPPDPYATAQAQGQVNTEALKTAAQLNQINQNNPFGSLSYAGDVGSPDRTQNVTLNPGLQSLLTTQEGNANKLATTAGNLIDATGNITPFNPGPNTVQQANLQHSVDGGPLTSTINDPTQGTQGHVFGANNVQGNIAPAQGQIQTSLGNTGQPVQGQIAGTGQFAPEVAAATQAAYEAQTGLLAPHEQQAQQALRSQLAAQGIDQGTTAYNDATNNLQQQQDLIRQQAAAGAVGQGLQAQQQAFGQQATSGQFANQAAGQQFQQALQSGEFGNEAQALSFGQNLQSAQFANQAAGQAFGQNMQNAQLANSLNNQQFGQNLAEAQFGNQTSNQYLANNIAAGQFANQAQLQQMQANQSLYQQNFGNQQAQQVQNINALQALNSGQQIAPTTPQFNPFAQSTASQAAPNLIGLAGSNYQAQSAANAGIMGSIFGGLGSIGAAYAGR